MGKTQINRGSSIYKKYIVYRIINERANSETKRIIRSSWSSNSLQEKMFDLFSWIGKIKFEKLVILYILSRIFFWDILEKENRKLYFLRPVKPKGSESNIIKCRKYTNEFSRVNVRIHFIWTNGRIFIDFANSITRIYWPEKWID